MNRKPPPNKIVAKFTQAQLNEHDHQLAASVRSQFQSQVNDYKRQKEELDLAQIRAVTELIKEVTLNLSKCGYLIGKLNKDNSR